MSDRDENETADSMRLCESCEGTLWTGDTDSYEVLGGMWLHKNCAARWREDEPDRWDEDGNERDQAEVEDAKRMYESGKWREPEDREDR